MAISSPCFVVAGTDTDVGKTVFAAALTGALDARYWKPVQAGRDDAGESDSARVARLSGAAGDRILPEAYRLETPCSPHRAAELDGVTIELARLALPDVAGPLVVELAGGLLVPLTRSATFIDVLVRWSCPVILVARTGLGTISHSLLSLEALRARNVPVHGIAFVGDSEPETERVIGKMGKVRRLGRLPVLDPLDAKALARAFHANFDLGDFRQ